MKKFLLLALILTSCQVPNSAPLPTPNATQAGELSRLQHSNTVTLLATQAAIREADAVRYSDLLYSSTQIGIVFLVAAGTLLTLALAARVAQDSFPKLGEFVRALAANRLDVARARTHEKGLPRGDGQLTHPETPFLPVSHPSGALRGGNTPIREPSETGLSLSPANLWVRDVLVGMSRLVGRDSLRLPSATARVKFGLHNGRCQPVINELLEREWLRHHLNGEALGIYCNGLTLGQLIDEVERGGLDVLMTDLENHKLNSPQFPPP